MCLYGKKLWNRFSKFCIQNFWRTVTFYTKITTVLLEIFIFKFLANLKKKFYI